MATVSFDKNIVIKEPEAVDRLVKSFSEKNVRPVKRELASDEAMARSEDILRLCLSRSKNS
jgi:hypothetical protein